MKSAFPVAAILLGMVLLLVSALWGSMFPATNNWTAEKSERLAELGSESNRLKFEIVQAKQNRQIHAGQNPAILQQEYDKLREEYDALHEEFVSARDSPQNTSSALRWVGIGLVAVGAIVTFVTRNA